MVTTLPSLAKKRAQLYQRLKYAEVLGITDLKFIYISKRFTAFQDSPFTGSPGPDSDRAWHDLLSNMSVRVSREELERGNQTSVQLPDGGYMAWLGVFHELHCIKMLRQWKYRDYYHPNLTREEEMHHDIHADHCLEMLRSASMCRADVSLTTFKWLAPTKNFTSSTDALAEQQATHRRNKPMLDSKRPLHVCVDWQALMASTSHRVVSEEESMRLRNPG
ncbi:hypothetical protein MMC07_003524 [Pseudocyphellaria aurata]|nr:hypothetical protein [Pseudocyphellaria aurata]